MKKYKVRNSTKLSTIGDDDFYRDCYNLVFTYSKSSNNHTVVGPFTMSGLKDLRKQLRKFIIEHESNK